MDEQVWPVISTIRNVVRPSVVVSMARPGCRLWVIAAVTVAFTATVLIHI